MSETRNITLYNIKSTTSDGKVDTKNRVGEKQYQELVEDAAKVGTQIEILKAQTFAITEASSIDEILQLVPNPEVALAHFNYGLTLAEHKVKNDFMDDDDQPSVDGAFDLISQPGVQEPKTGRAPADPASAMKRAMKKLFQTMNPGVPIPKYLEEATFEEINAVLAQFAKGAPTAA
jgi:hypothetical protein